MVGTIALRQQKFFQRATLLQLVITKDCSQQHRMQNIGNKQKSRKLELACDIDLNKKKLNKKIKKNWLAPFFSPPPTQNFQ